MVGEPIDSLIDEIEKGMAEVFRNNGAVVFGTEKKKIRLGNDEYSGISIDYFWLGKRCYMEETCFSSAMISERTASYFGSGFLDVLKHSIGFPQPNILRSFSMFL